MGDRYKVIDSSQTEYTYSVVDVSEADGKFTYLIDEMSMKRLDSSIEKLDEPDPGPTPPTG